ncbi:MAG: MerR family transcriptional regulator [Elusimicrobia bacterium]|nr:MerR family transcriptional regulator [Elusimicrobiota bacterium]
MPAIPRPIIPDKDLFKMEEACRILQLPAHTLRYWEDQIPSLKPARLPGGHRRYTRRHLESLLQVRDLMRDKRMTLAGARRTLLGERAEAKPTAANAGAAAKLLADVRTELQSILSELNR